MIYIFFSSASTLLILWMLANSLTRSTVFGGCWCCFLLVLAASQQHESLEGVNCASENVFVFYGGKEVFIGFCDTQSFLVEFQNIPSWLMRKNFHFIKLFIFALCRFYNISDLALVCSSFCCWCCRCSYNHCIVLKILQFRVYLAPCPIQTFHL